MRQRFIEEKDRFYIGWIKRFLEYDSMIPGFIEEFNDDPEGVMKKYGFPLAPEDVIFLPIDFTKPKVMTARFPESKAPIYADFINRKFRHVEELLKDCTPTEKRFAKWRENQIARCMLDLGPQYSSIVHIPITFELARGCSVGCEFCGLDAGPLKELFRYTDENAALWNDILMRMKELIGPAAGESTLYFASEPLDNPDYEKFLADHRRIFGTLPQLTTAVSTRNIDRLRPLIKELNEDGRFIYRFSVLSEDMFHELCEAFTPEELALVELLPQYETAPGNHFAVTGRCEETSDETPGGGTISCVSGFLVNMCTKTITLTSPTWSDKDHPEGQIISAREKFTDGADFQAKIEKMIGGMKTYLEPDDVLCTYPYLKYVNKDGTVQIESSRGTAYVFKGEDNGALVEKLFELVSEGCYNRHQIVAKFVERSDFPAVQSQYLFFLINRFWSKGIFYDKGGLNG